MKKAFSLVSIMMITVLVYGQDVATCETDEFTGETTCKTESINLSSAESNVSRTILQYIYQSETDIYYVVLSFGSSEWQYLNTDTVYFLLDGERASFELLRIDTDVSSGIVIEQYGIQLVSEDVERFINSEEIRFKIRNDIYEFNTEAKANLNSLKSKVDKMTSE